jgi:hypothetical protein
MKIKRLNTKADEVVSAKNSLATNTWNYRFRLRVAVRGRRSNWCFRPKAAVRIVKQEFLPQTVNVLVQRQTKAQLLAVRCNEYEGTSRNPVPASSAKIEVAKSI